MAKGVEDSAYYRWARFVALNEVGGDPARFGSTVAEFHAAQVRRAERRPRSMTTLSTHDTKRSEDVRARLAVLSELPGEWSELVRGLLARHPLADRPLAHLVWQNLVGAWPLSRERAHAYVEKAAREAGTSTTWTDPDQEFEEQLHSLVDAAFDDPTTSAEIDAFVARIAPLGWSNSLSQKLLQLTMPGVPDVYQGTELWDFSLVDPDNRRPVDYARAGSCWPPWTPARCRPSTRRARPSCSSSPACCAPAGTTPSGSPGTSRWRSRARRPSTWSPSTAGASSRWPPGCPRGLAAEGWGDAALQLPNGPWRDLLTGERFVSDVAGIAADAVLAKLPVALLVRTERRDPANSARGCPDRAPDCRGESGAHCPAQKRIASITLARTAMIAGSRPASAPTAVAASRPSIAAATGNAGTSCSGEPRIVVQGQRAHQRHRAGHRDQPGEERGDDALQHDRGEHPPGGGAEAAPDADLPDPLPHGDQPDVEHPERAEEQHQQPGAPDDPAQGVLELLLVAGVLPVHRRPGAVEERGQVARDGGDHGVGVGIGHPQLERRWPGRELRRLPLAGVPRPGRRVDPVGGRLPAEVLLDDADDRGERRCGAADHHRRPARRGPRRPAGSGSPR